MKSNFFFLILICFCCFGIRGLVGAKMENFNGVVLGFILIGIFVFGQRENEQKKEKFRKNLIIVFCCFRIKGQFLFCCGESGRKGRNVKVCIMFCLSCVDLNIW